MTLQKKSIAVQITTDGMGQGSPELKKILIKNYLKITNKENYLPAFMIFYSDGVKLLCEGSPVLDDLIELDEKGVTLIACKTCLSNLQLLKKIKIGIVSTMIDIVDIQYSVDKVINL